jgi:uncharacterized protein GlcG (DUF336 family)
VTGLDLQIAQEMVAASLAKAASMDIPIAVAVCDGGGHLVAYARTVDCMILAAETVQAKARTAVYFQRPSSETVERSRQHPTVYGSFVEVSKAPIVMSMGGFPLWHQGKVVGGIGAAGGTGAEDAEISAARLAVWEGLHPTP